VEENVMKRRNHGSLLSVCLGIVMLAPAFASPAAAACDPDGVQTSGAIYRICMPAEGTWNGDLVVWAHGYVAFNQPIAIPEDQLRLPDGTYLPDLVNALGFAFATTSYSTNGTAIRQGLDDVVDLVSVFVASKGPVDKVYLTGASEGGLITTLATEQHPDLFAGGLAACGPIGSFPLQVGYFGDFRVVFDYFFPGLVPGTPSGIPPELIDNWDSFYANVVKPTVFAPANLSKTLQLIKVANVPTDPADFWTSADHSIRDGLWYNVFGTNDAIDKLGGQPFENRRRLYLGSSNDVRLNLLVRRVASDPAAFSEMRAHYNTSGALSRPLVTMHTLLDQQVPAWHETLYAFKASAAGSLGKLLILPVNRYGHCNFTGPEVLLAFGLLVLKAQGQVPPNMELALKDDAARATFRGLARQYGLTGRQN
jgi:pimeloyl-ACP methyl ester carboxylesterase